MRSISMLVLVLLSAFVLAGCRASTPGETATTSPSVLPGQTGAPLPTVEPSQGANFMALHMLDAQTGWALASDQVWRTTDGGLHWRDVTPKPAASAAPAQVHTADFLSASLAWIALSSAQADVSAIAETTNGGQTWTALNYSMI